MVNVLEIVIPIVVGIVIIGVSFYLFIMYCHPEEKGIGTSILPKILVVFSQTLAWGQLLLLPLDISVSSDGGDFSVVYAVVYTIIFVFAIFINPFFIFLYEADESDPFFKRVLWSLLFSFAITSIWCAGVFISYIFLSGYTIAGLAYTLPVTMYIFLCMSLVGWILLAINAGVGLVYLPTDLIKAFINRPKVLNSEQALEKKQLLQNLSSELIGMGQKLKNSEMDLNKSESGWLGRKREEAKFSKEVEIFRDKVNQLEEQFQIFDQQIKVKAAHPVIYIVMLVFGVLAGVISLLWFIQIIGTVILSNKSPVFLFLDAPMASLSTSGVAFVGVLLFGIMTLYLQACVIKGNTTFGIRIPFIIKIHPMKLNKTYLNSMLFNSNIMMLASVSTSILAVWAFPTYLSTTYLYQIAYLAFDNQPFFSSIYGNRIPMATLEGVFIISFIVMIAKIIYAKCKESKGAEKKPKEQNQTEMKETKAAGST